MYDIFCSNNSRYPYQSSVSDPTAAVPTVTPNFSSSFPYPGDLVKQSTFTDSTKLSVEAYSTFNNNTVHLSDQLSISPAKVGGSSTLSTVSECCTSSPLTGTRSSLLVSRHRMNSSCGVGNTTEGSGLKLKDLLTYDSSVSRPAAQNCGLTMEYNQVADSRLMVDDLEPQARSRCNTWPLRPVINPPSIHDSESNPAEGVIKEEAEDVEAGSVLEDGSQSHNHSGGADNLTVTGSQNLNSSSELGSQTDINNVKKSTSRKNAWGNLSYADLITKAIQSTPDKKLTLSQIYDWMVQNVTYFRDKGDSTSSAGWKNSIRHNLSLHNRFMRIQNEGAGKSSWWVINPDAKPGKAPRRPRGGSMDSTKMSVKASRERAMKRVEMKKKGLLKDQSHSPVSPGNEFTLSPGDPYRERVSSFASNVSGRRSPDLLDTKLSPWGSEGQLDTYPNEFGMETGGGGVSKLHEDLDNMMNLDMRGVSLLDELEEIAAGNGSAPYSGEQGLPYQIPGKPYSSYNIGESAADGYRAPPPYPAGTTEPNQQQQFTTVSSASGIYGGKDPMMAGYTVNNGNNNSLSPNQASRQYKYANGMLTQTPSTQQQQPGRLGMMGPAPPNRVIPSSIRAALNNQSGLPPRPNNQSSAAIPQSLKDSAPILTQQLMDYQPPNQPPQPGQPPQASSAILYNSSQSNQAYVGSGYAPPDQGGIYQPRGSSSMTPNYYLNDIDFNMDSMPELLSCDVDEVLKQEVQMDGGQLDFSGFEGYSQQQNSSNTPTTNKSSNSKLGVMS